MSFNVVKQFFAALDDIEFLTLLDNANFEKKSVFLKKFYYSRVFSGLSRLLNIEKVKDRTFLSVAIREVVVWRISRVSTTSFKKYFVSKVSIASSRIVKCLDSAFKAVKQSKTPSPSPTIPKPPSVPLKIAKDMVGPRGTHKRIFNTLRKCGSETKVDIKIEVPTERKSRASIDYVIEENLGITEATIRLSPSHRWTKEDVQRSLIHELAHLMEDKARLFGGQAVSYEESENHTSEYEYFLDEVTSIWEVRDTSKVTKLFDDSVKYYEGEVVEEELIDNSTAKELSAAIGERDELEIDPTSEVSGFANTGRVSPPAVIFERSVNARETSFTRDNDHW